MIYEFLKGTGEEPKIKGIGDITKNNTMNTTTSHTLQEIRNGKTALEEAILKLVTEFERDYSVKLGSIELGRTHSGVKFGQFIVGTDIKITLDLNI